MGAFSSGDEAWTPEAEAPSGTATPRRRSTSGGLIEASSSRAASCTGRVGDGSPERRTAVGTFWATVRSQACEPTGTWPESTTMIASIFEVRSPFVTAVASAEKSPGEVTTSTPAADSALATSSEPTTPIVAGSDVLMRAPMRAAQEAARTVTVAA